MSVISERHVLLALCALGLSAGCSLSAAKTCASDAQCAEAFGPGATCGLDGFCIAPPDAAPDAAPPDAAPPDAAPPDAADGPLALADDCTSEIVPEVSLAPGSNEISFRVTTVGLADQIRDVAACLDPDGVAPATWTGSDGFLAIEMTANEKWHFDVSTSSPGGDPAVYVLPSCDALTCLRGNGFDGCGVGTAEHFSFVPTAAGRYLVGFDSRVAGGDTLDVSVVRPICGNNAFEHSESCDDGNQSPGGGWDERCRKEITSGEAEVEGNDDHTGANRVRLDAGMATITGQLVAPCDFDLFAVDVPQGGSIEGVLVQTGGTECAAGTVLATLGLLGPDGVTLLGAGARPADTCQIIGATEPFSSNLAAGTYYLAVSLPRDLGVTFDYQLQIRVPSAL